MDRALRQYLLVATCFLLAPFTFASVQIDELAEPVSIAGKWQFKSGDDLRWAVPSYDDSGWETANVPAFAPPSPLSEDGMGWYRLTLQLNQESRSVRDNSGALALTVGKVMSAYELYAGGQKIGGSGTFPPEPSSEYDHEQVLQIPSSAIEDDGRLVLAMRLWRDPAISAQWETGPYMGRYPLGNVGDLRADALASAIIPSAILAALYLVLGWYHLLIARRNPILREFFWFGFLSIALGIYSFEVSQARFLIDLPFWLHKKIEFLSLYILPVLLTQTLFTVTRTPLNRLFRLFYVVFLVLFAAVLLTPSMQMNLQTLKPYQYVGAVWSVCLAGIISWRAWQGVRSARIVFALLLLLVVAVFNDVLATSPWIESRQAVQYVGAFLLIFIALLMAERYTDVLKRLETSVEERTAELVTMNRELEAALQTKGNFLANMSHEMRTPMNAILGLTHLGLKTELTAQQRDYFTKVETAADGLQDIINKILDFSRLEEGEFELTSKTFSPADLMQAVINDWNHEADAAGLEMDVTSGPDLPAAVSGDEARLKQVLDIFVSNAIKFTEHGKIHLALSVIRLEEDSARLSFAVSDTGIGIDQKQREHLFEAFSQADNSMTRDFGGTGLGLALAQRLISKMGGEISLESTPGQGSTFSFVLALPIASAADLAAPDASQDTHAEDIDLAPIRGARVLLVDDSEINLQVAGELLSQAKLNVDMAHNGREAVDSVLTGDYECVLMDVQMPVMDGYTATETIRAEARFAELPILAMTANAMPEDRARGAKAGMNDYIPKPIDPSELHRALLKWIKPGEREYVEDSSNTHCADVSDVLDLPDELPGLRITEGMKRVGGNAKLYLNLLQDLCKAYAGVGEDIQSLLQGDKQEEARQLAHKLRGIANNLGAHDVGSLAEDIELSLKSGAAVDGNRIDELSNALSVLVATQARLTALMPSPQSEEACEEQDLQAMFAELVRAVEESNPESLDIAGKLLASVNESHAAFAALTAAHDALDCFDFSGAQQHLQGVEKAFDRTGENGE